MEGSHVAKLGNEATIQNKFQANDNASATSRKEPDVLASKSTVAEVQRKKILALLRQGPKTTLELREHGCLMPATRIFELKNQDGYTITSELISLYDAYGFRHSKCARYHLVDVVAGVGHE
jgi:hypothetical protein